MMRKKKLLTIIMATLLLLTSCRESRSFRGIELDHSDKALEAGEKIAREQCAQCHLLPEPQLLPQKSTNFMLSYMGLFYGIGSTRHIKHDPAYLGQYKSRYEYLKYLNQIPESPALSRDDWQLLRNYYLYYSLPGNPQMPTENENIQYRIDHFFGEVSEPGISLLKTDNRLIYGGYAYTGRLAIFNRKGDLLNTLDTGAPPVDVITCHNEKLVAVIGDLLGNRPKADPGVIFKLGADNRELKKLAASLPRMAHISCADLNNDNKEDIIVPGFGNLYSGRLIVLYKTENGYRRAEIDKGRSYVRAAARDFNKDGRTDILTLEADAREALSWYENTETGFKRHALVERHPAWGYTWLQLADVNGDGSEEILVSNGDNADSGPYNTLKKYHGLRIYEGNPATGITEVFHYRLQGAYSFNTADLNNNGRTDILLNSYYPDISPSAENKPLTKQVILFNKGGFNFTARRIKTGRRYRPTVSAVLPDGSIVTGTGNLAIRQHKGDKVISHTYPEDAVSLFRLSEVK